MLLFARSFCKILLPVLLILTTASFGGYTQDKLEKAAAPVVPIVRFTESYRLETVEASEPAENAPAAAVTGTYRIDVILPLTDFIPARVSANEDAFGITLGNTKIEVFPVHSPGWSRSNPVMRVDFSEGDGKNKPKRVFGKVRVRWTLNKLVMSVEGTIPGMTSPAAVLYTEEEPGKFTGETIALVKFGNQAREFRVSVKGEVKRETYNKIEGKATITTVELSGEGKPMDGGEPRIREEKLP
jgi:hypothetical protein